MNNWAPGLISGAGPTEREPDQIFLPKSTCSSCAVCTFQLRSGTAEGGTVKSLRLSGGACPLLLDPHSIGGGRSKHNENMPWVHAKRARRTGSVHGPGASPLYAETPIQVGLLRGREYHLQQMVLYDRARFCSIPNLRHQGGVI